MADKKKRYPQKDNRTDKRMKKLSEQFENEILESDNRPSKRGKNRPMTAAVAASHQAVVQAENAPKTSRKNTRENVRGKQKREKENKAPALPVRYTVWAA